MSFIDIEPDVDEIPPGDLDATIVEARVIESKKGTPGIAITYEDDAGRELEDAVWVTRNTRWRVEQLCTACEIPFPTGRIRLNVKDLEGKRVHVELEEQEYDGKTQVRVKEWTTASEPEIAPDTRGLPGKEFDTAFAEAADEEAS